MITQSDIYLGYNYFIRKKYSLKVLNTKTELTDKITDKFLLTLEKKYSLSTLGLNWLWRYLVFQFLYWEDLVIVSFNKKINFSYIFGEKALKRFFDRNSEFDFQLEDNTLLIKYTYSLTQFQSLFNENDKSEELYNNPNRLIGLNTSNGLNNCLMLTTLYNPRDNSCVQCKFKDDCKTLLKLNYPEIYKSRIDGKTVNR